MIDSNEMYENMMNKFKWGNAEKPGVYLDENNRRMFSNFRRLFGNLGKELLSTGDTLKAVEVARRGLEIVPAGKLPNDFFSIGLGEVLLRSGQKEEGNKIIGEIINYAKDYLDYSVSLDPGERYGLDYPSGINMQALLDIYRMAVNLDEKDLISVSEALINNYYDKLYTRK
jgi:tetratricopeptide (TPR) repeat protein